MDRAPHCSVHPQAPYGVSTETGLITVAQSPIQTPAAPRRRAVRLPPMFAALRQYNFRLYWFGQMISVMGTWMQSIGQSWLVLSLTHSAWQIGVVGALQMTPTLLFSIFAGVLADRWPRRLAL